MKGILNVVLDNEKECQFLGDMVYRIDDKGTLLIKRPQSYFPFAAFRNWVSYEFKELKEEGGEDAKPK